MSGNDLALVKMVDQAIEQNATINQLKSDVVTIKGDIRRLDSKIDRQGAELRELIHRQAIAAENTDRNIMLILDAVIPAQARAEKIDRLAHMVDNHEIRLSVVEGALKQHLGETHSSQS